MDLSTNQLAILALFGVEFILIIIVLLWRRKNRPLLPMYLEKMKAISKNNNEIVDKINNILDHDDQLKTYMKKYTLLHPTIDKLNVENTIEYLTNPWSLSAWYSIYGIVLISCGTIIGILELILIISKEFTGVMTLIYAFGIFMFGFPEIWGSDAVYIYQNYCNTYKKNCDYAKHIGINDISFSDFTKPSRDGKSSHIEEKKEEKHEKSG